MNTPGCIFQHVMSEEHFFPCRRRFPVSCNCCPASWCSCRRLWIRRREEIPLCHVRLSRHGHPSYTPLHPLLPLHRLKSLTCHRKLEGVLYHSPAVSEQNQPLFTLKSLTVVKCASSLGLWFKKMFKSLCRCFFDVTRQTAEKMLEANPENGSIIIRPSTLANNYAVTMRQQVARYDDPYLSSVQLFSRPSCTVNRIILICVIKPELPAWGKGM